MVVAASQHGPQEWRKSNFLLLLIIFQMVRLFDLLLSSPALYDSTETGHEPFRVISMKVVFAAAHAIGHLPNLLII